MADNLLRQVFIHVRLDKTLTANYEPVSHRDTPTAPSSSLFNNKVGMDIRHQRHIKQTKTTSSKENDTTYSTVQGNDEKPHTDKKKKKRKRKKKQTEHSDDEDSDHDNSDDENKEKKDEDHDHDHEHDEEFNGTPKLFGLKGKLAREALITYEKYELRMVNTKSTVSKIKELLNPDLSKPDDIEEDIGLTRKAIITDPNIDLLLLKRNPTATAVLRYRGDVLDDAKMLLDYQVETNVYGYVELHLDLYVEHGAPEDINTIGKRFLCGHYFAIRMGIETIVLFDVSFVFFVAISFTTQHTIVTNLFIFLSLFIKL